MSDQEGGGEAEAGDERLDVEGEGCVGVGGVVGRVAVVAEVEGVDGAF